MAQSSTFRQLTLLIALAVLVSLGFFTWIVRSTTPVHGGLKPGEMAPVIQAEGWLNGDAPTPESLAGKVIVVDAWASWCVPCRIEAPKLVKVHEKFRSRDVVFIGLTPEDKNELPAIMEFLEETGVTWLNGYGAAETLTAFEAFAIPNVWVVGADGKVVWNYASSGTIEEAIEEALSQGTS